MLQILNAVDDYPTRSGTGRQAITRQLNRLNMRALRGFWVVNLHGEGAACAGENRKAALPCSAAGPVNGPALS